MGIFFFSLLFLVSATSAYVNPKNPCHNKRDLGENSNCEAPVIPPRLCKDCRLKETDAAGNFLDCKSIFNITTPECRIQFQKYATRNPCDQLRNQQIAAFDENIESLDFFAYAVCEECCDCVREGSIEDQYAASAAAGTLFDFENRANCGTHAAVDICKVLPNVKVVVNTISQIPTAEELEQIPHICPLLKEWRDNRSSLPADEQNTVPEFAREFLSNYTKVASCGASSVWRSCVRLETAQSRI